MNQTVLPAPTMVELPAAPQTKWQREYESFRLLLPQLLTTHRGRYVAIHDGQVVDTGDDKVALALRVLVKVGNVPIHVGLVSDAPPAIARSGVRRDISSGGGAA